MYNGVNSTIDALRGEHDSMGSMAAGALTGAIFKSTGNLISFCIEFRLCFLTHFPLSAGIRPMAVAAILGSSLAGIWSYVKKSI
jgi:import inner membrane translocase subunit TIM23